MTRVGRAIIIALVLVWLLSLARADAAMLV